jgi:hypothetical protein
VTVVPASKVLLGCGFGQVSCDLCGRHSSHPEGDKGWWELAQSVVRRLEEQPYRFCSLGCLAGWVDYEAEVRGGVDWRMRT